MPGNEPHTLSEWVGTLTRVGGAFVLNGDDGVGRELELQRMPVDAVEKRVRVVGTLVAPGRIIAEGVVRI